VAVDRRKRLERWWYLLVMVWSLVRIAAVWHWLERYGVNPVVYAVIDLGSSVPYAICSAKSIGAIIDRRYRRAAMWGAGAAVAFAAPDVYIVGAGRSMPWATYAIVGGVALVAALLAVRSGRSEVASKRVISRSGEPSGTG